jgi:hypothetical protein
MRGADAPQRVVLFFDTHEAFWGAQRDQTPNYFIRDEWLRCLLETIDRRLGIVTVVAGRELPHWHLAERCPIDERLIEAQPIAHLSDADARAYLGHIGLTDDALCQALLDTARVAPTKSIRSTWGYAPTSCRQRRRRAYRWHPMPFRTTTWWPIREQCCSTG